MFFAPATAHASETEGYYRYPAIHGETIAFVAEDDLWTVPVSGGTATRLTTSLSTVAYPSVLARWGTPRFHRRGGGADRSFCHALQGWAVGTVDPLGFADDHPRLARRQGPVREPVRPTEPSARLGLCHRERWRRASNSFPMVPPIVSPRVARRLSWGRKMRRFAGWKRYRGGTAGEIYIDANGNGSFKELIDLESNLFDPMILGDRVYFLSDHERIGNLVFLHLRWKRSKEAHQS